MPLQELGCFQNPSFELRQGLIPDEAGQIHHFPFVAAFVPFDFKATGRQDAFHFVRVGLSVFLKDTIEQSAHFNPFFVGGLTLSP